MSIIKKIKWAYYGDNNDMNSTEKWYKTNKNISYFIDNYISDNLNLKCIDDEMKITLNEFLKGSNCMEKLQLMTVLSSLKLYFCE